MTKPARAILGFARSVMMKTLKKWIAEDVATEVCAKNSSGSTTIMQTRPI